jgi:hypothetical protein
MVSPSNNKIILEDILDELSESIVLLDKIKPSKDLPVEMIQKWKGQLIIRRITIEKEIISQ